MELELSICFKRSSYCPFNLSNRNYFQDKKHLDTNVLKRKSGDQAVETLDFKVADLRKKLNKLRYQSRTKQQRIDSLMKQYEKVVTMNAEMDKAEEILEDSAEGQRLRYIMLAKHANAFNTHTP